MSEKLTEDGVEAKIMEYLGENGWTVFGDPLQDEWGANELDERYDRELEEVVYWELLKEKIVEINEEIDEFDAEEIVDKLQRRMDTENLVEGNRKFYQLLRRGIKHTPQDGDEQIYVDLVDWATDVAPEERAAVFQDRNSIIAANQFRVHRKSKIRPDIVLFVNGIPLVPMEIKCTTEDSTVEDGIKDVKRYEEKEPRLFVPSLFNAVCDGEKFRYAAVGADKEFYFPWRSESYTEDDYEPRDAATDLLQPGTIRDIFRYFVFYEENEAKIVPRYMQYQAANQIIERIQNGDPRKGLIWHTQGSGKSYTMLFTAYKAKRLDYLEDAQYLLIVDRKKLNEQMEETLHNIEFPAFSVAQSIDHLEDLLSEEKGQLILTTVQKFQDTDEDINADVEMRTVVMVDEAHRFMERKLGNRLKNALAGDFFYFGFTGTPVAEGNNPTDRNTFQEFSPEGEKYLHRYSIKDGQQDNVITRVTFTLRTLEWDIPDSVLDEAFDKEFDDLTMEERQDILEEYVNRTELAELRGRLRKVVGDIQQHFRENVAPNGFKGMVVTPSRRAAALYGDELLSYFDPEEVKVIITTTGTDPDTIQRHHHSSEEERDIIQNFKKKENPKLLVVCDKLLTGFDAPILKTLYLDKPMKNHNLLQAIARTNRPMEGKENGEIVDYQGLFEDIEDVLEYDDFVIERAIVKTDELVDEFKTKLDELMEMFADIEFKNDPETFEDAIVKLEKNPQFARTFENRYQRAQNLWETLMPHEALGNDTVETQWSILSQIYARYRDTEEGGSVSLGDEVREKTRRILEEHMDIAQIEEEDQIEYEIPEREVQIEEMKDKPPEYGFITRAIGKKDTLEAKEDKNPVYSSLSERVKQIIEDWRNDRISASEGIKELEKVEQEEKQYAEEQSEKNLSDDEYAIFQLLVSDYPDEIDGEDEAREIAAAIGEVTEGERVGGNISELERDLQGKIITKLVEMGHVELCKGENREFVSRSVDFIVENRR